MVPERAPFFDCVDNVSPTSILPFLYSSSGKKVKHKAYLFSWLRCQYRHHCFVSSLLPVGRAPPQNCPDSFKEKRLTRAIANCNQKTNSSLLFFQRQTRVRPLAGGTSRKSFFSEKENKKESKAQPRARTRASACRLGEKKVKKKCKARQHMPEMWPLLLGGPRGTTCAVGLRASG